MVDVLNQIFNIASTQILWMEVVVLLFYILVFYFVIKLSDKIRYQLESKNNKIIVGLLIYFYISILIILEVKIFIKQSYLTTAIFSLLLILQLLFVGVAYVFILDRKSTRLNSSHVSISYAVFCLKKRTFTICVCYYYLLVM